MFKYLKLERPLAVIDVETTGLDLKTDRIVEMGVLIVSPDHPVFEWDHRFNPDRPIPPAATAIHGIRDVDVANEPQFAELAADILGVLDGSDLCGYNLKQFDLRMLNREMQRAGHYLDLTGRAILDPKEIFHQKEPRNLSAAVRKFVGRNHPQHHSAAADVRATAEVLDAMIGRYTDLPNNVTDLHQQFLGQSCVDFDGVFRYTDGEISFAKGKHHGRQLADIAVNEPGYLYWMLNESFFEDAKAIVRTALAVARKRTPVGV